MAWETVIGLEVHVELATETKIFCACTTKFGGAPNTHCCPVCTGMPGTLPVLNRKVLDFAVMAGLALNCEITKYNKFDRKNYFYPDLPKAYQISQLYLPVCRNGAVPIRVGGKEKTIRIHEIHMEEDAGKLVHDPFLDATRADYNRCGVPLIEIVSEADFRNAEEVIAYLEKLKSTLQYLGVSDCKMQEGSMRADINLSVREVGQTEFGTRTEMKNMNSMKAIGKAIEYEAKRQIGVIESGKHVIQETRRWDDNKGKSYAMRSKENAQDYRYFPEPDIPPVEITDADIEKLVASFPEFADAKKARYMAEFELPEYDADMITAEKPLADFFEATSALCGKPKEVSNWMMGDMMKLMKDHGLEASSLRITPETLALLIRKVESGSLNRRKAREIFAIAFAEEIDIEQYIRDNGLEQIRDDSAIESVVKQIIAENPKTVAEYLAGKTKVFGFFVGQSMRALKGQADPAIINEVVTRELSKLQEK